MLQYLSGVKLPLFKKAAKQVPQQNTGARSVALTKALIKNNNVKPSKPLQKAIKAAIKLPSVKKAIANEKAIRTIAIKSPVTASKIRRQQVQQVIKQQQNRPSEKYATPTLPIPTETEEITKELVNEADTEDYTDFTDDIDTEYEETGEFEDGEIGALLKKVAQKKAQKKADKVEQKAAKSAAKPSVIKAKAKAEAKVAKASNPNKGKVLTKLIDTGAKILDTKLNKGATDLSETEVSEKYKDQNENKGFLASIPTPIKIGGGLALLFFGYKAFKN